MNVLQEILRLFNTTWKDVGASYEVPELFGTYHLISLAAMVGVTILLCFLWKIKLIKNPRKVILVTAIIVGLFEIYKQIVYNVSYDPEIKFNNEYCWTFFPWQFCSTPLYIGLLAGLTNPRGRLHKYFCSYLGSFALFAGLAVMIYPGDVFNQTVGICIQTVVCHASMVVIAIFLFYTGYLKPNFTTLLRAACVFSVTMGIAIFFNELTHNMGVFFNAFFFSPYHSSTLPVYSEVHNSLMAENPANYPICLAIYVVGFTLVAGIMLLLVKAFIKLGTFDFDAQYAEEDAIRKQKLKEREDRLERLEEKRREEIREERREKKEKKKAKKEAKKEKEEAKKEKKKAEQRQRKEEREAERDAELAAEKREKLERERERKERKKARKEAEKAEDKAIKEARKEAKRLEREKDREYQKQLNELKKKKRAEEKAQRKAERAEKRAIRKQRKEEKRILREQKRLARKEEKAYAKWVKQQELYGQNVPDQNYQPTQNYNINYEIYDPYENGEDYDY